MSGNKSFRAPHACKPSTAHALVMLRVETATVFRGVLGVAVPLLRLLGLRELRLLAEVAAHWSWVSRSSGLGEHALACLLWGERNPSRCILISFVSRTSFLRHLESLGSDHSSWQGLLCLFESNIFTVY